MLLWYFGSTYNKFGTIQRIKFQEALRARQESSLDRSPVCHRIHTSLPDKLTLRSTLRVSTFNSVVFKAETCSELESSNTEATLRTRNKEQELEIAGLKSFTTKLLYVLLVH